MSCVTPGVWSQSHQAIEVPTDGGHCYAGAVQNLELQVARLERELRLWRRLALAALLACIAAILTAQTWGLPSLEGTGFVLRHSTTGREVGSWTVNERGDPRFGLQRWEGNEYAGFAALNVEEGRVYLHLSGGPDSGIVLRDVDGHTRARFQLDERGDPFVVLFDREGRQVWRAP